VGDSRPLVVPFPARRSLPTPILSARNTAGTFRCLIWWQLL
jgi:hypothetical protein